MLAARNKDEIQKYIEFLNYKLNHIGTIAIKQIVKNKIKSIIGKNETQINLNGFDFTSSCNDVCLCGACIIFTPTFLSKHSDNLFYPITRFYHEEEILYYKLKKTRDYMRYDPSMKVFHDHSVSTATKFSNLRERLRFQYNNNINSCKVILEMLDKDECNGRN